VHQFWHFKVHHSLSQLKFYDIALERSGKAPFLIQFWGQMELQDIHNNNLVKVPVIVVGRKVSASEVVWEKSDCWPIDTTYYIKHDESKIAYMYLYYVLKSANLQNLRGGIGIPSLNRNVASELFIPLPDMLTQEAIVTHIENEQKLVESTQQLIALYEQKIKDRTNKLCNK